MLFDIHNIIFDELQGELIRSKAIQLTIARLDKIHPVVSGNKLFKLHYFLEDFSSGHYSSIQTYGGAFSNHLVATAYACHQLNIPCKGIVRGERPVTISHTLRQCIDYGMELEFLSRTAYAAISQGQDKSGEVLIIPEGGFHPQGARGASLIMDAVGSQPSHICLAAGTATTLAGILQKTTAHQQLVAIPVLKGFTDMAERIEILNGGNDYNSLNMWDDYHFGGYAKKTTALLSFMNDLYSSYGLSTDFVYTAKMMYAVFDKIARDYFAPGSSILCLHTGGLQGNDSLPPGSLIF